MDNIHVGMLSGSTPTSTAWDTTKKIYYMPVLVGATCSVTGFNIPIGTANTGNLDIALYTLDGTRLTGSVARAAGTTSTMQSISVTAVTIGPGSYYIGMGCDATTVSIASVTHTQPAWCRAVGILEEVVSGTFACPATATFAALTSATPVIPWVSMAVTWMPGSIMRTPAPPVISPYSIFAAHTNTGMSSSTSGTYPVANRAFYFPFWLPEQYTVTKMFTMNGATADKNVDVGIYHDNGTRIESIRHTLGFDTPQSGTNTIQLYDLTDVTLGPGNYYMALAMDGTTGTLFRNTPNSAPSLAVMGIRQQASAYPLPDPATFADMNTTTVPIFGLTNRTIL